MKKSILTILLLILGIATLCFSACNKTSTVITPYPDTDPNASKTEGIKKLSVPTVTRKDAESDLSSLTFSWETVAEADYYEAVVSVGENVKYTCAVTETEFTLDEQYIDELGKYVISVFAKDADNTYAPSVGTYTLNVTRGSMEKFPIEISTPEQFIAIETFPDGFFRLTNDIDFSGVAYQPICAGDSAFAGCLDGNGYSLKNVTLVSDKNKIEYDLYVGVFGRIYYGTVKNLKIENFSSNSPALYYTGEEYIGTLAGLNIGGVTENVTVINSNINWNTFRNLGSPLYCVGGLFGMLCEDATVSGCVVNVNVALSTPFNENFYTDASGIITSTDYTYGYFSSLFVGGIAGSAQITKKIAKDMTIEKCSTSGNITAQGNVLATGGFLGHVSVASTLKQPYQTVIYDSLSTCSFAVSEEDGYPFNGDFKKYIGLAVGKADFIVMKRCYLNVFVKTQNISFDDVPTGYIPESNALALVATFGFVGYGHGQAGSADTSPRPRVFVDCYYNTEKITQNVDYFTKIGSFKKDIYQEGSIEIIALDESDISSKDSFEGFDFENVWKWDNAPVLR